jgi:hypothetical protein
MLGGLTLVEGDRRRLKELFFAVAHVGGSAVAACAPDPAWDVASLFAPRSGTLFFLARPDWTELPPSARDETFSFPLVPGAEACFTAPPDPSPSEVPADTPSVVPSEVGR